MIVLLVHKQTFWNASALLHVAGLSSNLGLSHWTVGLTSAHWSISWHLALQAEINPVKNSACFTQEADNPLVFLTSGSQIPDHVSNLVFLNYQPKRCPWWINSTDTYLPIHPTITRLNSTANFCPWMSKIHVDLQSQCALPIIWKILQCVLLTYPVMTDEHKTLIIFPKLQHNFILVVCCKIGDGYI